MDSGGQFYFTQGLYDGPTTKFGFVNGSYVVKENVAAIRESFNFSGVTDGHSFFAKFCRGRTPATKETIGPIQTKTVNVSETPARRAVPIPTGYPQPIVAQSGLSIHGYHLSDSGYRDVAVLALPNFQPLAIPNKEADSTIAGFLEAQETLRELIKLAVERNRTKLIVDLRGNSGGTIDMAFELFKQLFPNIEPLAASRSRAHEAFRMYSSSIADLARNKSAAMDNARCFIEVMHSTANFANLLDSQGKAFPDFETYYGTYKVNNDEFTAVQRYNLSNHFGGHTLSPYVNISGYGSSSKEAQRPFQPEDIVILQDGFCGSACAIFSRLMRDQGHVQTIAVGGRPRNGPMQGVGGTKGALLLRFES
jgi:hypothetical protein